MPARNSPAFCDEYDRFNRDVAGELYSRKQENLRKKEELYAVKRAENYYREKSIWDKMDGEESREASRFDSQRQAGMGQRRNQGSESYNIISLDYYNNPKGERLAQRDAAVKEARQVRANNLHSKAHSVTHNIITGEPIKFPAAVKPAAAPPPPPQKQQQSSPWS
ncbi:hypothetical protein HYH03_011764 [Edaphochlamys debaryana]|uniref:Uncharacterized protein n=1 Tax=Edaphochlamys debaryana TaxID=47281 RepID=A0A835XZL8_9CHLO|nr:hypothetical protein HYH03_011764 [Edaphochlamys debaryana]|eukprot:KAG2489815.1 hypothetical protein HYH03_011764 [Edaphochlamys debaryana]